VQRLIEVVRFESLVYFNYIILLIKYRISYSDKTYCDNLQSKHSQLNHKKEVKCKTNSQLIINPTGGRVIQRNDLQQPAEEDKSYRL
jgi:hypothetical protein